MFKINLKVSKISGIRNPDPVSGISGIRYPGVSLSGCYPVSGIRQNMVSGTALPRIDHIPTKPIPSINDSLGEKELPKVGIKSCLLQFVLVSSRFESPASSKNVSNGTADSFLEILNSSTKSDRFLLSSSVISPNFRSLPA